MALNLTQKQIDEFDNWKADYLTKIGYMREVIRISDPDRCEENTFFKALGKVAAEIDEFVVEREYAIYGVKITSEKTFFFNLSEYLNKIEIQMAKYPMSDVVESTFRQKRLDAKHIFEI